MHASARRIVVVLVSVALMLACSRTGIGIGEALDAGARADVLDEDAASVTIVPLSHARIELVLVVDRSGSMEQPIDEADPGGPTRWEALTTALERALGALAADVVVGAKLYPDESDGPLDPLALCATSPTLTIAPASDGRTRVIDEMRASRPRGGTPTAQAIDVALTALDGSPFTRRAVLLVTDGAPNCNADTGVPPDRCICSTDPAECARDTTGLLCLDDRQALDAIDRAVIGHVPVIVVGIDDPGRPDLAAVLDRMAIVGSRPRPEGSAHRFHSVRSAEQLEAALESVSAEISACTFVPDGSGVLGGEMTIELGGARVPESPIDGWIASPVSLNAVELRGSYCEQALRRDRSLVARVLVPGTDGMDPTRLTLAPP
jgi:hypothetical protein